MAKVKNLEDLHKLRERLKLKSPTSNDKGRIQGLVQIKIAMATCSIASGARETMQYMTEELDKRNIEAIVTQTGCMGYCYAEPTIEISVPGKKPVVFGNVNEKKADEIIEKFIKGGELVEGTIPVNYRNIDEPK